MLTCHAERRGQGSSTHSVSSSSMGDCALRFLTGRSTWNRQTTLAFVHAWVGTCILIRLWYSAHDEISALPPFTGNLWMS